MFYAEAKATNGEHYVYVFLKASYRSLLNVHIQIPAVIRLPRKNRKYIQMILNDSFFYYLKEYEI